MSGRTSRGGSRWTAAQAMAMGLLSLVLGASQAAAEAVEPAAAAGSDLVQCLRMLNPPIVYPLDELRLRVGGTVRVALTFTGPDAAPDAEVLADFSSPTLLREVKFGVDRFRLPCLTPQQAPVTLVQTFRFDPLNEPHLSWTPAQLADASGRPRPAALPTDEGQDGELQQCVTTPKHPPTIRPGPEDRAVTNVILDMEFRAADQPPMLKTVYRFGSADTEESVRQYAAGYRLPCLPPSHAPVRVRQTFALHWYEAKGGRFRNPMSLDSFLATMKNADDRPVRFDFDTMGCPFEVDWALGLPAVPNRVRSVGAVVPARAPLLDWLRHLEMKLEPIRFNLLLGQTARVQVPCGTLERQGP